MPIFFFILLLDREDRNVGLSIDEEIINRFKQIIIIIIACMHALCCVFVSDPNGVCK